MVSNIISDRLQNSGFSVGFSSGSRGLFWKPSYITIDDGLGYQKVGFFLPGFGYPNCDYWWQAHKPIKTNKQSNDNK